MKSTIYAFCSLILVLGMANAKAALPYTVENNPNINAQPAPTKTAMPKGVVYQIKVPGKDIGNGYYTPTKIYNVERVAQKDLVPNAIYVKTKTNLQTVGKEKVYPTILMKSTFGSIKMLKIRAPFADFNKGNLLSNDEIGISRIYEVYYEGLTDPYDLCQELMKNPDVEYAEPMYRRYPYNFTPNDQLISKQYYLENIKAYAAWDETKGDKTMIIGIVDSGVEWNHPDLAANIWANSIEKVANGLDDDKNGKIDDYRGWDLVGNVTSSQINQGNFQEDNDPKPISTAVDHGTHVAGCASAVSNNGMGIAGIGYNCVLLPVKCSADNANVQGIWRGYEGIAYAAKCGAKVINCSWGGAGRSVSEQQIIDQITANGVLIVVAAGNDGKNIDMGSQFPAAYDNVLCVGATNESNKPTYFTNYGYKTTVYAPGSGIFSTVPGSTYENMDGTSMASPITAGLAGLVRTVFPNYSPMQVLHQIRSTSDNVVSPTNRPMFYGRINAYNAVTYNTTKYPTKMIPGCTVSDYAISGTSSLSDNNQHSVQLTLTNYLAPTSNLKVTYTSLDYFLEIVESGATVGVVPTLGTSKVDINVRLKENNPWYSGNANILVTFTDGTYTDYKLVQIPISVSSKNTYTSLANFADYFSPQMNIGHAPNKQSMWLAGYSSGYQKGFVLRYTSSATDINFTVSDPMYAVYGFDDNRVVAGTGPKSLQANILRSINAGQTWTPSDVSGITGFVNSINFYDDMNGIFLGDPINLQWGIGRTSDGGQTWMPIQSISKAQSGETGYVGSACFIRKNMWFGTNKGRVYSSTNKGGSWTVSTVDASSRIMSIAFVDSLHGAVIYASSNSNDNVRYIANTTDGGKTWKTAVYNFANGVVVPFNLYPVASKYVLAQCTGGQILATQDLGVNWIPVLAKQIPEITAGACFSSNDTVRIWSAGNSVSMLDFKIPVFNAVKLLTNTGITNISFDTTAIGSSLVKYDTLSNKGNVSISISSYTITPGENTSTDEFKVMVGAPTNLAAGASDDYRVKFAPKTTGKKTAILTIFNDSDTPSIQITLIGNANEGISKEITSDKSMLEFDSTFINASDTKSLVLSNSGNTEFTIDSIIVVQGVDEFSIISNINTPSILTAGNTIPLSLKFAPHSAGQKVGQLVVYSKGTPAILSIPLHGYGKTDASVMEPAENHGITIYPNPAKNDCRIDFENKDIRTIQISSINGVSLLDDVIPAGEYVYFLNTSNYSNGTYLVTLVQNNGSKFFIRLNIQR